MFKAMLPKVQKLYRGLRSIADTYPHLSQLDRKEMSATLAEQCQLDREVCTDALTQHLRLRGATDARMTPTQFTVRLVARYFVCAERVVEQAVRRRPTRNAKRP